MDAEGATERSGPITRRYTGATRLDAAAGFKFDWPALSARYSVVAEAWDDDTRTLTVFLEARADQAVAADEPAPGARRD